MTRSPCVECGSTKDLTDDRKCPDCGVRSLVKVVNETIQFTENVVVSMGIYFELTDPVWVPGTFTNSLDIKLEFNSTKKNLLKSFTIQSENTPKEIIKALHKAARLTNYLTFKTGLFVYHKQGRKVINGQITEETVGGISTVITALNDLDLSNSNLENLLSQTSKENLQLAHLASGQKALNDSNYPEAIREFFLVIENSGIPEEVTYRPLRHAVSHERLDSANTVASLNANFGLSWNVGDSLDPTDPNVDDFLRQESKNLREISWHHIYRSISI